MKHLLVFIDFTPATELALEQALNMDGNKGKHISLCHVVQPNDSQSLDKATEAMQKLKDKVEATGAKVEVIIEKGDLFEKAKAVVAKARPDLVVAGTHGAEGIHMTLFGSAIRKLVREVAAPTLVVGKKCEVVSSGFTSILVPAGVQSTYMKEVSLACNLLGSNGEITLFAIRKGDEPLIKEAADNLAAAKALLNKRSVKWKYKEISEKAHSVGYAAQTLEYMRNEKMQLIAISAEVSARFQHFGKPDKEAILLNEDGIMVLCVNDNLVSAE